MTAADIESVTDRKAIAGLQARAALLGFELVVLPDGTFIVKKWNLMRELATLAEVEAFLVRVGAPPA